MLKIISYLTEDKNLTDNKPALNPISLDIIFIEIVYDMIAQKPLVTIKLELDTAISDKFMHQAEQFAIFLFNMCGDNSYMVQPVLDALTNYKHISHSHLLFVNNVIFLWDKLMSQTYVSHNEPVVRPSQVFRQLEN